MTFQGQGQSFTCREGLHLPGGEVQLGQRTEVGVLKEILRQLCHALAHGKYPFHALLIEVGELADAC